ncbi:hypothetical protein [Gemmobacter sp. 24YEA27]|uniref:hypothetical protein n=1 Tax=Gemmobacter sp. 24YEA27 TaxID=3040672 RepID=UPI0024B35B28|nr:hypothetical protein [Gemmobacter sp. 24YEA27]
MNFVSLVIGGTPPTSPTWLSAVLPGITVALGAGITLFLLNWLREWLTAHWKRKTDAGVLAFSLVTEFDRLVGDCTEVINDPLQVNGQGWRATVNSPRMTFPESWDWRCFPSKLQYRIRSIPNQIALADGYVHDLYFYGEGPPEYEDAFDERILRYAAIGIEAVLINETLAKEYGVPLLDRGDWDPVEKFNREIQKIRVKHKVAEAKAKAARRRKPTNARAKVASDNHDAERP